MTEACCVRACVPIYSLCYYVALPPYETYLSHLSIFMLQYVQNNKEADNDWFRLESNKEGTRWFGKCWYIHELLKYEFDIEFDVSTS